MRRILAMQIYDLNLLADTVDCRTLLSRLSQEDLAEFRNVLLPWPFSDSRKPHKFAVPRSKKKRRKGKTWLHEVKDRMDLINAWMKRPKPEIIEEICEWKFTPSQLKVAILLVILGSNGRKDKVSKKVLQDRVDELQLPKSGTNIPDLIYTLTAWSYVPPSELLTPLLEKTSESIRQKSFGDADEINKLKVKNLLDRIGIPDTIASIPFACKRFKVFAFLLENIFIKEDYNALIANHEVYPRLKEDRRSKIQFAKNLALYTNYALTDLIAHAFEKEKLTQQWIKYLRLAKKGEHPFPPIKRAGKPLNLQLVQEILSDIIDYDY